MVDCAVFIVLSKDNFYRQGVLSIASKKHTRYKSSKVVFLESYEELFKKISVYSLSEKRVPVVLFFDSLNQMLKNPIVTNFADAIFYKNDSISYVEGFLDSDVVTPACYSKITFSSREQEFISLYLRGLSDWKISEIMQITKKTVSGYRSKTLNKLKVRTKNSLLMSFNNGNHQFQ
ncbi:helix-turn-helix transcriptional regulator [Serratia sp. N21D137]|uniref:helix-turn-helix transcriptional regulator n=1 Tax=Serratia sp. N21D137 TaxID=3397495 RepID=UPI0039DFE1A8